MNVLFKLSVIKRDGTLAGSVLEKFNLLSAEGFDETKPKKIIDLLAKRVHETFRDFECETTVFEFRGNAFLNIP